ncbi:DUF1772 domain-containing protein [Aliifodinibius sp. S!AR15-10]|uniref:anthrone oxygenase family protein n=1 Tax=Aliifodinibius sp. S!AR15-10 TaxID=2950437 RepID=UPI002858E2A8|nr:anthrone oxygenase family protein [Aliifodinibius sp. S!AR15-10]MDR8393771.1 DUF1772 domain-containing protein [Aliifodinibius sp. S!AR15-10]
MGFPAEKWHGIEDFPRYRRHRYLGKFYPNYKLLNLSVLMISLDHLLSLITLLASLGSGLMAGLFFVFSCSIMKALAELRSGVGITAMQAINRAILNPVFVLVFWGTPVFCVLVMISTFLHWQGPSSIYLIAGGAFYLVGGLLTTLIIHVPMNNALATVIPSDPGAASHWESYVNRWTSWNHLRTVMTLLAMALFIAALY